MSATPTLPTSDAALPRWRRLNRFSAALVHLAISAVIASATFLTIYLLWFPGALFQAAGGLKLFLLIVGVDVVLGPLLTFVVYVPDKKSLGFDLSVIAVLQLAGLGYGVYVLSEARPAYIVFVQDRFELARANHLDPEGLAKAAPRGFGDAPLTGPRIVGARLPTNQDELFKLMASAAAGIDVQGFPQYYVPYDEVRGDVLKSAQPVPKLREFNADAPAEVDKTLARIGRPEAELRFLPMRSGAVDLTVFVDARDARVVHIARLHPWQFR